MASPMHSPAALHKPPPIGRLTPLTSDKHALAAVPARLGIDRFLARALSPLDGGQMSLSSGDPASFAVEGFAVKDTITFALDGHASAHARNTAETAR